MKNIKARLLSLLLTLVMLTGVLAAFPMEAFAAPNAQTRTLMLYLVGANLESNWECATWNLVQSMEADHDENLNYIVMTGGSKEWHTEAEYLDGAKAVDAEYDQIWKLEGKRDGEEHGKMKLLEPTGIEGFEKANMGKAETLTSFVDYCYENYPADQYDLILWDHGGAFTRGFGMDERFDERGPISVPHMVAALKKTKLVKDQRKFEIIDFDACLMAGPEVAAAFAPYADYLVASAELEPGSGQEYTGWLNAVRENPGMNGFELGKLIVDGLAAFYTDEVEEEGTLAVIDLKNFTERLMPLISELDDILLREAKSLGELNGRYNFYDELYSLLTAFGYDGGDISLYDLGTLVGSLSSPQSEMDNIDDDEIDALTNAYTETALKILAVLGDRDGSGDDVIYSAESAITRRTVDGYSVRGLDGAFLPPDESGYLTIRPTGFNIFFGDGKIPEAYTYLDQIKYANDLLTDGPTLSFLEKRGLSAAYYALIVRFGQVVSELSESAEGSVTWADVKENLKQSSAYFDRSGVPDIIRYIAAHDDDFASEDGVEAYFSKIIDQQAGEALRKDKIGVKKLVDANGDSIFYQVTIRDASSQSLMSVLSAAKLKVGNYESPEFEETLSTYFNKTYSEMYPNGVWFYGPDYEGTLDHYRYYEALDDSDADIYQRVYSDPTSVWIVPQVDTYCFVLTDQNGAEHPARIDYRDRSRTRASIPIRIIFADGISDAYIEISFGENGWQTDGVSFYSDTERSCYPMDSDFFDGAKYTTAAGLPDYNGNAYLNPISQFCEIDVSKKDWGISLGWKKIGEIDEIVNSVPAHFVTDVYGYRIDITDLFASADEAAKQGDVAYTIDCADFTVAEAVYDGSAQTPKVTASLQGAALTEGEDYKVLYDGSSNPGDARIVVIGIGDFYGALDLTYTIKDSLAVKVDGTEIGGDDYTVDEETGAVTLTEEYLKTLAVGGHTLTVVISGVESTTDFTVDPVENKDTEGNEGESTTDFTVDPVEYKVTEGNEAEWTKNGGNDLSFRTDAGTGKLFAVRIDGADAAAGSYAVGEDGTVTLKDAFLKTLSDGEHALTLVFTDGEASARFTVRAAKDPSCVTPQTGDDSRTVLWIVIMTVSAAGAASIILFDRKHGVSEK